MTKVINFYGGPGAGKSTMAALLFAELKQKGVNVELVQEYAKDLTWQESEKVLRNQIYIFGKQHHRIWRLSDKVDVIITDSPLLLCLYYGQHLKDNFRNLVISEHNKYNNIEIYLTRGNTQYSSIGRWQTHEQAKEMDKEIYPFINGILNEQHRTYDLIIDSSKESISKIIDYLKF